MLFDICL